MAGFLIYISIFVLVGIWILGWAGVSLAAGAFFDLPMGTSSMLGAVLGPIGFVVTILVGVVAKRPGEGDSFAPPVSHPFISSDPFA